MSDEEKTRTLSLQVSKDELQPMERVIESSATPPADVTHLGIAIQVGGGHIGLIYRVTARKPARLLHLCGHGRLRSDELTEDYVLWIAPSIPENKARSIGALCRRIWRRNAANGLPYGFSQPNRFFDYTGNVLRGLGKVGLTCASFVLAVFDAARFRLVQYDTWPEPTDGDVALQRQYGDDLEANQQVPRDHVRAYREEIGNIRYRPLEVAGAATSDSFPCDYPYAARVGIRIRRKLTSLRFGVST